MSYSGWAKIAVTKWDTLQFNWEITSQSIANNTSTIAWNMQLIATSDGAINTSNPKPYTITVNGTNYYGTAVPAIANNSTITLAKGSTVVPHNSDGTKKLTFAFSQSFEGIYFSGNNLGVVSGDGYATLDAIPRKATITAAPNFTDEDNPKITYTNETGNAAEQLQACISFDKSADNIAYRDISKTGTSYTFNLTAAERTVLRKALASKTSMTVYFYIKTTIGGTNYYSSLAKTLSITNAEPQLAPEVVDTNSTTVALTGNANTLVKGYSNATFAFNAEALKAATIKTYKVTNGSKSSSSASGVFNATDNKSFVFTVTDSRGKTATKTVNKTFIDYIKLTCSLAVTDTSASGAITYKISGKYFNGTFGATNNSIALQYKLVDETSGTNFRDWTNQTVTLSGNSYNVGLKFVGLDYTHEYTLSVKVSDKLSSATASKSSKVTPVFDWSEEDFNFNVPVTVSGYNLLGAAKALSNAYALKTTVTAGSNYSAASGTDAILMGNNLRCYFTATRSAAPAAGNVTNETVAHMTINHGGKIKAMYANSLVNNATGGVASFTIASANLTATTLEFDINLCATTTTDKGFSCYFIVPVALNLDAY